MTKIEIIQDTVDFYSADVTRRSLATINNKEYCVYKGPDGKECGFQRVIEDNLSQYDKKTTFGFGISSNQIMLSLPDIKFKEGYKGHDSKFWAEIQGLHDTNGYWNENGLSERGKQQVQYLKNKYTEEIIIS